MIGLDIETNGLNPRLNKITVLGLYVDGKPEIITDQSAMKIRLLELKDELIVAHNAKFDVGFIYAQLGILLENVYCTMLGSQILFNGKVFEHSLKNNLDYFLSVKVNKDLQKSFITNELTKEQVAYLTDDIKYLIKLREKQLELLTKYDLLNIVKLENTVLPVLAKMEVDGCKIDEPAWKLQIDKWQNKLEEIEDELDQEIVRLSKEFPKLRGGIYTRPRKREKLIKQDLFGNQEIITNENTGNINYASSKQILDIFSKTDSPYPTDKYGKISADENSIKTYLNENKSKLKHFLTVLLKYREYAKLISTYGDKFLSLLEDSYIHTQYSQCFTHTGRLSSSMPNLQNIPRPNKDYNLRKYFIAEEGHIFATYDLSGAELRIAAEFSREPMLLKQFQEGLDLHSVIASDSFSLITGEKIVVSDSKIPIIVKGIELVPNTLRSVHKQVIFGKLYGAGPSRIYQVLAEYINKFNEENRLEICKQISNSIDRKMPILTKYLKDLIDTATTSRDLAGNREYYLRANKFGRIRFFTEDSAGEACNYPIQCTNADAIKIALIKLHKLFKEVGYGRIVLTVHDEVTVELPEDKQDLHIRVQEILQESLQVFFTTITAKSDGAVSKSWEK